VYICMYSMYKCVFTGYTVLYVIVCVYIYDEYEMYNNIYTHIMQTQCLMLDAINLN